MVSVRSEREIHHAFEVLEVAYSIFLENEEPDEEDGQMIASLSRNLHILAWCLGDERGDSFGELVSSWSDRFGMEVPE